MTRARRDRAWDAAVAVLLAALVAGPKLVERGVVLRGDMVFVPDQPWKPGWLGLDGRLPRFVPGDALTWLLGTVLPGDLVQRLLLVAPLVAGSLGCALLLSRHTILARTAAATLFVWNPWVDQRLGIGQWGVVVGYLLLPWCVLAAARVRDRRPGGWPALVAVLGLSAVFSPASGLVAVAVAVGQVAAGRAWRAAALTALSGLGLNLPWILPSLLVTGTMSASGRQFDAFAARAESSLGVVASLVSLGGIWKTSVLPGERTSAIVVGLAVVVAGVGLAGLRLTRGSERVMSVGLLLVAVPALSLAVLTALPPVAEAMDGMAEGWPVLGILRDTHRYLGPWALALAVGLAASVDALRSRAAVPGREGLTALAGLLAAAPVLCLPSLAWGRAGDLDPVRFPDEWSAARAVMPPGRSVVLPWRGAYRGFSWNDRRAGLDPAPRFFPGDVLVDDRIDAGRVRLGSEDPLLRAVDRALRSTDPVERLRALGVRTVLVEKDQAPDPAWVGPQPAGADVVHEGSELRLLDLGAPGTAGDDVSGLDPAARTAVLVVDGMVLVTVLAAGALGVSGARRRRC